MSGTAGKESSCVAHMVQPQSVSFYKIKAVLGLLADKGK